MLQTVSTEDQFGSRSASVNVEVGCTTEPCDCMAVSVSRPTPLVSAPIQLGVFDSGVGGLSVLQEIMRELPDLPVMYLADQAHAPYGGRSMDEIRAYSESIARFLTGLGAGVIVIACNTASAAALHTLRREMPGTPFVGMEPAVKPAAERTRSGHIGVIATEATFQGELFASLMDRFAHDVSVHNQVCPELVPLVEAGDLDSVRARDAVREYLDPLLSRGIDQLVLGCTHYPFLRPVIEGVAGSGVEIHDPAPAVARQTGRIIEQLGWPRGKERAQTPRFFTTGDKDRLAAFVRRNLELDAPIRSAVWLPDGSLKTV